MRIHHTKNDTAITVESNGRPPMKNQSVMNALKKSISI